MKDPGRRNLLNPFVGTRGAIGGRLGCSFSRLQMIISGFGYDYGYGDGYGSRWVFRSGTGSGFGAFYVDGSGYGNGFGDGYGDGDSNGYGWGEELPADYGE